MPGNLGLWDMVEALKFVNKNIKYFGGDPNKITIYGYSAGGASVSILSVSPYSNNLFNQCIQMSGSPLSAWALNERTINETFNLANKLNCLNKNLIKNCLTNKSISDIWNAVDNKIALFIGRNTSLAAYAIPWNEINNFDFNQFKYKVDNIIAKNEFFGEKIAKELSQEIIEFYLNNDPLNEFNYFENTKTSNYYLQRYTLLLSDIQFIISIINDSQLKILNNWPIYLYYNLHYNPKTFPKQVKIHQSFHTNDENLLLRNIDYELNEEDLNVEQFLTQSFINFIKFGNPSIYSIKWNKATNKFPTQHMRIINEPKLEKQFDLDLLARQEFYKKILIKYGNIWDLIRGKK
ncbi:hypothetical protein Mgra_00006313 [Meloidogyne graminicola]|uniref:Carboxylic ester hydrolase n=1 Tax=Meloidogyne graminicola TaxID=189291 RepID=A0A8S9ZMN8_9BILA|nr:hypothetical protein Mgra_00006313 [Meloidogyne graminicola]